MNDVYDVNKYLADDGRGGKNIAYNDLASPLFGSKSPEAGLSRANFSAGAVVEGYDEKGEFTSETLGRINAIKDLDLVQSLSRTNSIADIFRSIVISFNSNKLFVITVHFTELGARYMSTISKRKYEIDTEYYEFGVFDINLNSRDGKYFDCGVKLNNGDKLKCVLNAENGLVSLRDCFFKEIPMCIVSEALNGCGGLDFKEEDKLNVGGVEIKDLRYGNRVMRKVTDADIVSNPDYAAYKDESEDQRTMRQTLSLFVPENLDKNRKGGNGVILCIHGGSWVGGDKSGYDSLCKYYASLGYFAATVNHTYAGRIYDDNGETATFLSIENELDLAMKKIKELSDENGWNITKAATHGYSSGSHLATWYAYDMGSRKGAPIPVVCTFSMVGPMSFYLDCWQSRTMPIGPQIAGIGLNDPKLFEVPEGRDDLVQLLKDVTEGKKPRSVINAYDFTSYDKATYDEKIDSVSPLSFVKKGKAVPTVLAEAGLDNVLISINQGLEMEKALTEAGVEHKVIIFPNTDHMGAGNAECGNVYRKYQKIYLKRYFGY